MQLLTVILAFVFFCVRGILLWLVIPAAICLWLAALPARALSRHPYLQLRKVLGWADLNVSAAIGQVLLRPVGGNVAFVPWSEIDEVQHRVGWLDPW
jgi:hypothetical protein